MAPDDSTTHAEPHPPVGSVAQETARLLEALLGPGFGEPAASPAPSPPPADRGPSRRACPTCGHTEGAADPDPTEAGSACRVCPVCQVLRVVRAVRPETLDRLADLAAAVTETLRDAAAHRWTESAGGQGDTPGRPAGPEVHEIVVTDDDDDDDDGDDDHSEGSDDDDDGDERDVRVEESR